MPTKAINSPSTAPASVALTSTSQTTASTVAAFSVPAGAVVALTNSNSGLCIDVPDASTQQGQQLQQFGCNGTRAQQFVAQANADGTTTFINSNSGLCMAVRASGTANGTPLQQSSCNGTPAQKFVLTSASGGFSLVSSLGSSSLPLCVDVPDASTSAGALMQIYSCNSTRAQSFSMAPAQTVRPLINENSGLCLTAPDSNERTQMVQKACDGTTAQQWSFEAAALGASPSGSSYYQIRNIGTGMCLDVLGFGTSNGTILDQWPCTQNNNQLWKVNSLGPDRVQIATALNGKCIEILGWATASGSGADMWDCHGGVPDNQAWLAGQATYVSWSSQPGTLTSPISNPLKASFEGKTTRLSDGRLMATFGNPVSNGEALGSLISSDGGQTWGSFLEVNRAYNGNNGNFTTSEPTVQSLVTQYGTCVDMANPFPLEMKYNSALKGSVLVAFRDRTAICGQPASEASGYASWSTHRLQVAILKPGASTFTYLSTIVDREAVEGYWEPFLLERSDGTIQAYFSEEYFSGSNLNQRVAMKSSSDGVSWGAKTVVADTGYNRDGMPVAADLGNNHLMVAFESNTGANGTFMINQIHSYDGGKTWTNRGPVFETAKYAGAPAIANVPGVGIFVGFQTTADNSNAPVGNDPNYTSDTSFEAVFSADQGKTFGSRFTIAGGADSSGKWHPAIWGSLFSDSSNQLLGLAGVDGAAAVELGNPVTPLYSQSLVNEHSGLCLDDAGWSTNERTQMIQWECTGNPNQDWIVEARGSGLVQFRNSFSDMCLDVLGYGTTDGTGVDQWPCTGNANQLWQMNLLGDGSSNRKQLISDWNSKCVDMLGFSTADGTGAEVWACHDGTSNNQVWLSTDQP
ncbi:MAG: RICIN domain-containing protein [Oligoflexia bacterium]|nr:RICIN domain-containing protein [Oligoflexia bacterium]